MAKLGENLIAQSGLAPFFKVANADTVGITPPDNRKGDALRTWVRSLSGFQKEAHSGQLLHDEGLHAEAHHGRRC